ncbi:MAG: bifunctional 4-hydroxy-2-oxoglutarate aldolase/2-dehydro-3-deoxy-phosphogluconate aldolase [Spirochaetota bacterium]
MTQEQVIQKIEKAKLISVLAIERAEDTPYIADALARGGAEVVELLLRTEAAFAALEILLRDYQEQFTISAGTVLSLEQLKKVADLGTPYAVAPGFQAEIVAKAQELGLVFFPGILTPSDIEGTLKFGLKLLKFFPSGAIGGLQYLQTMHAPYAHLGIKYIPLGGVKPDNLAEYIRSPLVAGVGGSWLAPKDIIAAKNWARITQNAQEAKQIIQNALAGAAS